MSRLDEELAAALAEAEGEATPSTTPSTDRGVEGAGASRGDADGDSPPVVASTVATGAPPGGGADAARRRRRHRNLGLVAGLLLMGSTVLAIVLSGVNTAVWDVRVDEVVAAPGRYEGRTIRLEGILVKGSLKRRDDPCEYRFELEQNGQRVPVRYPKCTVPDTFRDVPDTDVKVSATGSLQSDGHFAATHIMAKCPSKYEMKDRAEKGEVAPHGSVAGGDEPSAEPAEGEPADG